MERKNQDKTIHIFIGSLRGGGAERICVTIANGLINRGYNVKLIVLNLNNAVYQKQLHPQVQIFNLKKKHTRRCFFSIYSYILKNKPATILVFNYQIALILVLIKITRQYNYKIIARNINTLSVKLKHEKSFWNKYIINGITKVLYKKVDLVIAQSENMKNDLIKNYNFSIDKLNVINNPIPYHIEAHRKTEKNHIKNNKRSIKEILFIGRLEEAKGLDMLLNAIKICISVDKHIILRVVGRGSLEQKLKKRVQEEGMDSNVIFEGFAQNVISYYENAAVTVLSSYYEGFPNVLVESIALGTPVVAYDCPSGPKEIINNGVNGFLVEYLNVQELSKYLLKALTHEWNDFEIINSIKHLSLDNVLEKYIKILEK
ncbi:glycosyltransferase [Anaerovirgula multivorans]|uniref:glycosyltransferase n=1 Tax=Anaerovirgula multivorans TaxID=312168 RepID=UPI0015955CDB|nr:glycosyltransferase [Anaerovirgula multivorans]